MNNKGLFAKKMPTLVGVLILLAGLAAGIVLVNQRQIIGTKAGPTESPKNVKITNRSTNGFTVSWTTDTSVTGFAKFSENPAQVTTPAGDARDQISGTAQSYTNHYININGLGADKTYYFVLGSGPQTYNDEGKPFQVRTGKQVIPPAEDVITGKIVTATGDTVSGGIVYVEVEGGEPLSTITKADGTWRINLAAARTKAGDVLEYDNDTALISIFVQAGTSGSATALTNTAKDSPVPDIVLGKNQTFIDSQSGGLTDQQAEQATKVGEGFKSLAAQPMALDIPTATEATGSFQILNPQLNGEMIATSSPEFRGRALPGTDIKITVHSLVEMSQFIKSDKDGVWAWTPPQGLDPGIHTLTLEYQDELGILQKIERSFTVLAADAYSGVPAFTATPSATPILTPTAVLTPIITPTIELTPSAGPEAVPTEVIVAMPATDSSTLTGAGAISNTVLLLVFGFGLIFFGKILKILSSD